MSKIGDTRLIKIPHRRCLGCRSSSPKVDLVRLVRIGREIFLDTEHSSGGRGAYLHRRKECIERAEKDVKRWEYAFRIAKGKKKGGANIGSPIRSDGDTDGKNEDRVGLKKGINTDRDKIGSVSQGLDRSSLGEVLERLKMRGVSKEDHVEDKNL